MNEIKKYIGNFTKYRYLLFELIKKDIKLKYRRSYLGVFWTLLEPLLNMIVLVIVFGTMFGREDPTFPIYVLTGRLLYSFFSTGTKAGMKAIRSNSAIIKKVYVPKYIYPLASVTSNYLIFLMSLIVLVGVSIVLRLKPTMHLFGVIVPLVSILFMALGIGFILCTLTVFFRDIEYLWSVALTLIMYSCAIFYKPDRLINTNNGWILKYNPLYALISCFRNSIFGKALIIDEVVIGVGFSLGVFVIGLIVFLKNQDRFIMHI